MRDLLAISFVFLTFGCSILDPGDRDELRARIRSMPSDEISMLTMAAMNSEAYQWLLGRPPADQVGKIQCRTQTDGEWTAWTDQEPPFLVFDLKKCLLDYPFEMTYLLCTKEFESVQTQMKTNELKNSVPGATNVECKYVWDWRYEPDRVPNELIDSKAISVDDIIDTLIKLPAPPPGWAFPELVPLLCPLGAGTGWGCPPKPDDSMGGQQPPPADGSSGDHQ